MADLVFKYLRFLAKSTQVCFNYSESLAFLVIFAVFRLFMQLFQQFQLAGPNLEKLKTLSDTWSMRRGIKSIHLLTFLPQWFLGEQNLYAYILYVRWVHKWAKMHFALYQITSWSTCVHTSYLHIALLYLELMKTALVILWNHWVES